MRKHVRMGIFQISRNQPNLAGLGTSFGGKFRQLLVQKPVTAISYTTVHEVRYGTVWGRKYAAVLWDQESIALCKIGFHRHLFQAAAGQLQTRQTLT